MTNSLCWFYAIFSKFIGKCIGNLWKKVPFHEGGGWKGTRKLFSYCAEHGSHVFDQLEFAFSLVIIFY